MWDSCDIPNTALKHSSDDESNTGIIILVEFLLGDLIVGFIQMREHMQDVDLPESQYMILHFM